MAASRIMKEVEHTHTHKQNRWEALGCGGNKDEKYEEQNEWN